MNVACGATRLRSVVLLPLAMISPRKRRCGIASSLSHTTVCKDTQRCGASVCDEFCGRKVTEFCRANSLQFQNYHNLIMKDDRRVITEFCKIVQRFPDLYDHNSDTYRRWCAESAWEKVADCVRNELHEECTVEELKMKWKGIRSSYNRYKNRVFKSKFDSRPFKDYYLHKTLKFLDPFIKPKGAIPNVADAQIVFEECYDQSMLDENDISTEYTANSTWAEVDVDIKPVVLQKNPDKDEATTSNDPINTKTKKRKRDDDEIDEENEDLQFFKSILPDIKDFTSKEKRKLKMSILKAIDEIENERKNSQET